MASHFESSYPTTETQIATIERLNPYSPFSTAAYAAAHAELGQIPCAFTVKVGSETVSGCLGFLQKGAISRHLEIVSAPRSSHSNLLWNGVFDFCRKHGVWDLEINTYASDVMDIPSRPGELDRYKRCEFVLDLTNPDALTGPAIKHHRRNLKRAEKAGLIVRRTYDPAASEEHLSLIQASLSRRQERGEAVEMPESPRFFESLLKHRAAELFLAVDGEKVISSLLVVRAIHSAYTQSSGSSPEGMQLGASAFLNLEIAEIMKNEGVERLYLGGVRADEQSLMEHKAGFGGDPVFSEAASFSFASPLKEKFRTSARVIRQSLGDFRSALQRLSTSLTLSWAMLDGLDVAIMEMFLYA